MSASAQRKQTRVLFVLCLASAIISGLRSKTSIQACGVKQPLRSAASPSELGAYGGNGGAPCEESKRDLLPASRPAFWITFRSSSCTDFVVETSVGLGECDGNPTTQAQSWKGAVGIGQNARPPAQAGVCYRTRPINSGQWSQWQILSRRLAEPAATEIYDVSVP